MSNNINDLLTQGLLNSFAGKTISKKMPLSGIRINKMKKYKTNLKAIIFDFNGVMVDDFPLQKEAWNQISLKLRKQPVTDQEMIEKIRGVPTKNTIKWLTNNKISEEKIEILSKQKDEITEKLFKTSPLFRLNKGLEEFLDQLKTKKIPRAIATSSNSNIFSFSFKKLKLNKWFDFDKILLNDGTYPGKPAPDAYILAAKKIGFDPKQCIVIEDAISGIQSAYVAGVKNIIVIGNRKITNFLRTYPGVIKAIQNFYEIKVEDLFDFN